MRMKSASRTIIRDHNWLGPAIHPGELLLEEYLKPFNGHDLGDPSLDQRIGRGFMELFHSPVSLVCPKHHVRLQRPARSRGHSCRIQRWRLRLRCVERVVRRVGLRRGRAAPRLDLFQDRLELSVPCGRGRRR
jgi:hypothetical protein